MIARLWFVLSLLWGSVFFFNAMSRVHPHLDGIDAILILGPLALGVFVRVAYRYVRYGPSVRRRY